MRLDDDPDLTVGVQLQRCFRPRRQMNFKEYAAIHLRNDGNIPARECDEPSAQHVSGTDVLRGGRSQNDIARADADPDSCPRFRGRQRNLKM